MKNIFGGVGRGMAINLKHLGFNTFIHSVVGKYIFGEYLRKGLEEEGIRTDLLSESPERKTMKYANLIDLFGCNEYEAASILGEKSVLPDLTTVSKFKQLGYKNFIITFGQQGVMVTIGDETWNEPPYTPSQIVDTIGAGDAFASGFLMGFLEGDPLKRCIHYGLACAKETLLTRQTVSNKLSKSFLESY